MEEIIRIFHKQPFNVRVQFHINASRNGMTIEEYLSQRAEKDNLLKPIPHNN